MLCALIAGIFAAFFGGRAFATAGNVAEISGGKTWNICVDAGSSYAGSDFSADIVKSGFNSQIVLGNGGCKAVKVETGTYAVSLNSTMGTGAVSYEIADDTLTFSVVSGLRKFINVFGSIAYSVEGSGEESQFDLLFSMPGECQFNGNANVSGETCKDGDGNSLTNKKYIDTGVALFSEDNAGRDFEIYFTLTDYATTQIKQGTLFNAKYENSSMYYPGFTIRTVSTDGEAMEITGRLGKDNTNADKANNGITTADIKNKEVKIVRVGGMVSYSIDGGELIPFQDYKNFNRYFEQTAVFGASMQTNGSPQRYYDGTIKNIRVYLKKVTTASIVFDANGGNGTMATIKNIEVGTNVTLPANTFTHLNAVFNSWNTKADGTGAIYADEAVVLISAAEKVCLYAQWDGKAILDNGIDVDIKLKKIAGSDFSHTNNTNGYQAENTNIKAIRRASSLPSGFDTSNMRNIISADSSVSPKPIYAWFDNGDSDEDGEGDGIIYVYTEADIIEGGQRMDYMFSNMQSLSDIDELTNWDTSNVAYMNGMFAEDESLSDISALASWNTSSLTEMTMMFGETSITNANALETKQHEGKNYTSWDVSNVVDMGRIFDDVKQLANISALASWNTSSAISMSRMFHDAKLLSDISPLAGWDVSKVLDMASMFSFTAITNVNALSGWSVSNVTNMSFMFYNTRSLTDVSALANWNTSNVTDMSGLFQSATSLSNISALADWSTSSVTDMHGMFGSTRITNADALKTEQHAGNGYVSWNTSNVTNMASMFNDAKYLSDISALASWTTSSVTDMSGMFTSASSLTDISALANWDTSNVVNMYSMFHLASSISSVSALASWNLSSVDSMNGMFQYMTSLTDISGLAHWNTSSVKVMRNMFAYDTSLTDVSALVGWNTSSVASMTSMFLEVPATSLPYWYH